MSDNQSRGSYLLQEYVFTEICQHRALVLMRKLGRLTTCRSAPACRSPFPGGGVRGGPYVRLRGVRTYVPTRGRRRGGGRSRFPPVPTISC